MILRFAFFFLLFLISGAEVTAQSDVDLSISLDSAATVVPVGSNFNLRFTVENLGDDPATFVSTSHALPAELIYISSPDACVINLSSIACTVGDLAAGELVTLSYLLRGTGVGSQNTDVLAAAAETEANQSNNKASLQVDVVISEATDIALTGSVSPLVVDMGDEVDVEFVVTNVGAASAYLSVVDFVIPPQLEFVSSDDCRVSDSILKCRLPALDVGVSMAVSSTMRAIAPGNSVTISALVSHFDEDPDVSNNGVNLSFTINEPPPDSADLDFSSMSPSASQFLMGEPVQITYTVLNSGPNDATNVRLIHELPAEIDFVSSGDCAFAYDQIICEIQNLGLNEVFVVSARITSSVATDVISSSANIQADEFDPNIFNNFQSLSLPSIVAIPTPIIITATPIPTVPPPPLPPEENPDPELDLEEAGEGDEDPTSESDLDESDGTDSDGNNPGGADESVPDDIPPSAVYGWTRYESADLIQVTGSWSLRSMRNASDRGYHESRDAGGTLRYPFTGDGFRIGYRSEVNGALFQIILDGDFVDTYDTNFQNIDGSEMRQTFITQPYWVTPGYHVVDIQCLADGEGREGCNIDFVEVFRGPPIPEAQNQSDDGSSAIDEVIVDDIELIEIPPTPIPTVAPRPASVITAEVIVGVDFNANEQLDANEGVEGITIRAIDVSDNSLLSTSVTDQSGFVQISVSTSSDVVLLIPSLGETFYIRNNGNQVEETWALLLDPANVPGLIP